MCQNKEQGDDELINLSYYTTFDSEGIAIIWRKKYLWLYELVEITISKWTNTITYFDPIGTITNQEPSPSRQIFQEYYAGILSLSRITVLIIIICMKLINSVVACVGSSNVIVYSVE